MVGSDHFHQLWLDNMPQFLVGKAPFYDANYYNEEREFGLPRMQLRGHEDLSAHLLRGGIDAGFDLAFSNELRVDHSITCPIITLRPQADLPIVPVYTNIFAPPMPQPKRFVELGRAIRALVESWPSDQRVAIIGTGHLSLELGGPRQFGPHGPDPEFDRKAVAWIASSDLDAALAEVSLDSLWQPGNATHGFMDFMLMMGVAGENAKADYVDSLDLFHTMEAYFTWYPEGRAGPRVGEGRGGAGRRRRPRVSKYLVNKFLYTIDRDPDLVERYREDPAGTVAWWEAERANVILNCPSAERSTWLSFTDAERDALSRHDYVALFELGAHNFLMLTLFIALFERDYARAAGLPARVRGPAEPLERALSRHRDLITALRGVTGSDLTPDGDHVLRGRPEQGEPVLDRVVPVPEHDIRVLADKGRVGCVDLFAPSIGRIGVNEHQFAMRPYQPRQLLELRGRDDVIGAGTGLHDGAQRAGGRQVAHDGRPGRAGGAANTPQPAGPAAPGAAAVTRAARGGHGWRAPIGQFRDCSAGHGCRSRRAGTSANAASLNRVERNGYGPGILLAAEKGAASLSRCGYRRGAAEA